ncbi:MAG: sigma-54 interaction domain-containing protein [Acidobacteriota bacterium]
MGGAGRFGERYLSEYAPLFVRSPQLRAIKRIIEQAADTSATILIRGESGVGKEIVARAIHAASARHERPFIKVNCAALPAELLESELFGHEKGAFTGAYRRKLGKFEFAAKGTIFLDEIGELPLGLQAKLLHVVQDLEFSRIGGREMIRVDVRVLASTNRNLEAALSNGEFREDLYYRLNVVEIHIPPLRERKEEIPILASSFLDRFNQEYRRNVALRPEMNRLFTEYTWPGNIRELENLIRRLAVLGNGRQIHEELLTRLRAAKAKPLTPRNPVEESVSPSLHAEVTMGLKGIAHRAALEAERKALSEVLDRVRWNRAQAARLLQVSYKTLLNKIAESGLAAPRDRRQS